jgi:prevent-host-death family protein
MARPVHSWTIENARANLNELIERAISDGPQRVTRGGKGVVVVVSAADWERRHRGRGDLVDFFANSPLREEGLTIERLTDYR